MDATWAASAAASSRSSASSAATPRAQAERLLERVLGYRIFEDDAGRMNLSLSDIGGGLLLVPQFTLAADTHKGTRPGFSTAAEPPKRARTLFTELLAAARACHARGRGRRIRRSHAGIAGE